MYPHERSLVERLKDAPFTIVGVNSDDKVRAAKAVSENSLTWRSFWSGPQGTRGPIPAAWNVTGWPTIYVLDAQGVIRFKDVRGEALDQAVDSLLAEMKGSESGGR